MDATGAVLTPLDEAGLRAAIAALLDAGCEAAGDPFPARLRQPGA